MSFQIIQPAFAAGSVDLGDVVGVGPFQQIIGSPASTLETLVSRILGVLTGVASLAFIIYFVLGALNWITAGGDKAKIESAQKQMVNAITGLVIVVIAYFIAGIIGFVLGIPILNPAQIIGQ
jgi:hypothetical protein